MPITIPPNRKITIEPKQGGGYQSAGLPDGLPPGALTMGTTTKTATSITGVVTDGNGSTSYQIRVNGGTWQSGLTATGLTAETTYSVEWRGVNANGTGPATTPENVTTSAQAATGFTGANGETITLSGSGFGALANPLPAAMDDMSYSGTADGVAPPATNWNSITGPFGDGYVVDEATQLPGRTRSLKAAGKKAYLFESKPLSGGRPRSVNSIYSTFWIRFNESTNTPPQPGLSSNKIIRVWDDVSKNGVSVAWQATNHPFLYVDNQGGNSTISTYPTNSPFYNSPNQWHRVEYYSSVDGVGPIQLFLNGKKVSDLTGAFKSSVGGSATFFTHLIGFDVSERVDVTDTMRHWLADFYEQPDLARVELSNSPTLDVSVEQERYYQESITRADSEVTFKAFYGGLNLGSPVYAHIIKPDGTVIDWGQIN